MRYIKRQLHFVNRSCSLTSHRIQFVSIHCCLQSVQCICCCCTLSGQLLLKL